MLKILYTLITLITLLFFKPAETPARLNKKADKPIIKIPPLTLLFIIGVITIFIIATIIIFQTGSLESTRIYNNRL